jgi:protein-tyrosine phosphatase
MSRLSSAPLLTHSSADRTRRFSRRTFLSGSLQGLVLSTLAGPSLSGCGSGPLGPTPRLASVDNFRDVAGADDASAYRTASGQKLRRGIIFRSNALSAPSSADLATLGSFDIRTIFDFRTPGEIQTHPDMPPAGATETNFNLDGTQNVVTPAFTSPADSFAYMQNSYVAFVADAGTRGRLGQVFRAMANTPGRHLYHCSGGKDRTGWVTATLLSIMGVPQDTIVQDYLLTNVYTQASIQAGYQETLAADGQAAADIVYPVLIADQRYLYAALDQVTAQYGTMASYVSDGLGVDAAAQASLRSLLL